MNLIEFNFYIFIVLSLKEEESPLLGKNPKEYAQILRWISFANSEVITASAKAFGIILGRSSFNKKQLDEGYAETEKIVEIFESRLNDFTYLVGERLTLADIFAASTFYRAFDLMWGKEFIAKHKSLARWYKTVISTPYLSWFFKDFKFLTSPVEPPKPVKKEKAKKEEAPKQAKKAEKKPEPAADEPVEEKKPKHPLEALGKPTIPIDEWKRTYSNEETREVALPYFWDKFYNEEEWSLWKVDYKYNDELTLTFMSNNLVGGFFNRLSASTKFMFGCMVVYGENNNNGITGAFLVRGQEAIPAFDVAPDYESYAFTKLDGKDAEARAFVDNMWAWDQPVDVNGEKREIADGKVFK